MTPLGIDPAHWARLTPDLREGLEADNGGKFADAPVYPLLDERFKAADAYLAEEQTQLADAELTPRIRTALANAFAGGMMHQFKIDNAARTAVPLAERND